MATPTLAEKMEKARLLIFNSKDSQIAPLLLDRVGIDETYIAEGEALYTDAQTLSADQKKEYQEERLAYDQYFTARDSVKDSFESTLDRAKILSRNDADLQNRLKLHQSEIHAIESWIDYASGFYDALLLETEFMTKMTRFKLPAEVLTTQKADVEHLKVLRDRAKKEQGEAQQATVDRNNKLEELDDYCTELKGFAKIALADQPQLLEKLGIRVRSTE